jgi:Hg(II)-responsive transcriptional regulator
MTLTIGQLATAADVNIQTLRYYERRGLLSAPERTAAGYRQYDGDHLRRVRFIKRAQALGFSLREIQELLALRVRSDARCAPVEAKTRARIADVDQKLRELQRLRVTLVELAESCRARRVTSECPVLGALEHEDDDARRAG